tara:strand:+ start:2823 stop:3140 length:318 start_codon:yes stop_codon:yes gene_type:complete
MHKTGKSTSANLQSLMSVFEEMANTSQSVTELQNRMAEVENNSSNSPYKGWMLLKKAAEHMGYSASALRQIVKHPTKPMPEGKVWKQDGPNTTMLIHLAALGEHL